MPKTLLLCSPTSVARVDTDRLAPLGPAGVPTGHQLRAALRASRSLEEEEGTPLTVARDSYLRLPGDGLYRLVDYEAGQNILLACGLLTIHGELLFRTPQLDRLLLADEDEAEPLLAELCLAANPPLWLRVAARDDEVRPELIPDDAARDLAELVPDPERREALLLAAGRRYDDTEMRRIGELGELHVVACCIKELEDLSRPDLAALVVRASQISDELGYDVIAPSLTRTRRIEVKTTSRGGHRVEINISRNEVTTGLRDPAWSLVVCRLDSGGDASIVGWCVAADLVTNLPTDPDQGGRWTAARVTIAAELLQPGLPD